LGDLRERCRLLPLREDCSPPASRVLSAGELCWLGAWTSLDEAAPGFWAASRLPDIRLTRPLINSDYPLCLLKKRASLTLPRKKSWRLSTTRFESRQSGFRGPEFGEEIIHTGKTTAAGEQQAEQHQQIGDPKFDAVIEDHKGALF
jgi:hypothetical protein